MSDGAHQGVSAGRALDTILGGEPAPETDEGMTPAQMRAYLEKADEAPPEGDGGAWYSEGSRRFGRTILAFLDEHPEHRDLGAEDTYEFPDPRNDDVYRITAKGLYTLAKEAGLPIEDGLSGFMVGWGVNAAKYAIGAPPAPNPAIVTVDL